MTSERNERAMGCDEFRGRIGLFLGGKLDRLDLERFVDHATRCTPCETCLLASPEDGRADEGAGAPRRSER